jgi:hypothetical protein
MLAFLHNIPNGMACNFLRTSYDTSPGCGSGDFKKFITAKKIFQVIACYSSICQAGS